jgi:hypothetical protein
MIIFLNLLYKIDYQPILEHADIHSSSLSGWLRSLTIGMSWTRDIVVTPDRRYVYDRRYFSRSSKIKKL